MHHTFLFLPFIRGKLGIQSCLWEGIR